MRQRASPLRRVSTVRSLWITGDHLHTDGGDRGSVTAQKKTLRCEPQQRSRVHEHVVPFFLAGRNLHYFAVQGQRSRARHGPDPDTCRHASSVQPGAGSLCMWSLDAPELHGSVTSENQFHCTRLVPVTTLPRLGDTGSGTVAELSAVSLPVG